MAIFNVANSTFQTHNKTLFESVFLSDIYGKPVSGANPTGMAVDAFGRMRVSTPLTLFDSNHRYSDNGQWATANTSTATYGFNTNGAFINLNVDTTADAEVIRETRKVFTYQPGKSLQILNTFVFNSAKTNLRQRTGYFGSTNGVYLELVNNTINFVERTSITGTVTELRFPQSIWNADKLDGSGPSGIILDLTKAQILFFDIEWLGVGTVRCGFVINGQFILCHSIHHANIISDPYMATATLPVRMEIKNTGTTSGNSTLKQICTSVISEGGYELSGLQAAVETPIGTPRELTTAGVYYPVISIRLKSSRLDAVAIITAVSILGIGNNARFNWKILTDTTLTSPSWQTTSEQSSVEYDLSATAVSGNNALTSGFTAATTQSAIPVSIDRNSLFKYQLTRNSLSNTANIITLAIASAASGDDVLASLDWEEISR